VLGQTWRQIADDIGQKSITSISKRVGDYVNDLAER
jgi:hypothetical protein